MKYSVIVPCYNEEGNVAALVERFNTFASEKDMELVLVDNGSKDSTSEKIDEQVALHSYVKKVTVTENQGYGFGILSGLAAAEGDNLGWIHADLQSDPRVFITMFESADQEKAPYLYKGARSNRSIVDYFFTWGMAIFETCLFGIGLMDCNSQPTLMSRSFYESWKNPPKDFSLDLYAYVLAKKKKITLRRFASVQSKRLSGESTWNVNPQARFKMVKRVVDYSKAVKKLVKDEM